MTHLRRYLEEHGVLYPEQLAEASRRQQIYGGSLDTVLLELELVDPVTLGEMLERACGFPVVPHELLDNGLERPWDEIPDEMQRSRWVEPLAREGDEIVVAVHPDLPNDQLGKLLRSVRRLRPMVTLECCLEKVAAERHQSVVPQRYAILCAAYLSAVRRRPSVSGTFDALDDEQPDATSSEPDRALPRARVVTDLDLSITRAPPGAIPPVRYPTAKDVAAKDVAATPEMPTPETPDDAPPGETPPDDLPPVAGSIEVDDPASVAPAGDHAKVSDEALATSPPAPVIPPVRDEADVLRRLDQARAVLEAARSRDDALEAIAAAAMVLSPRVGLFRARGEELVGLSTPSSAIADLGGKVVAASEGSAAAIASEQGYFRGAAPEADLRLATGASATTPCVLSRVEVRGRPVVFVYVDRDGEPIDARDAQWLDELAVLAGRVFEEILKLRRSPAPPTPPPITPPNRAASGLHPGPSWGRPTAPVRAAYGDGEGDEPVEPAPAEPLPSRASTPELEHPDGRFPPPPLVIPTVPIPEPVRWRLSPELAAQALEQRATVELISGGGTATVDAATGVSERSPEDPTQGAERPSEDVTVVGRRPEPPSDDLDPLKLVDPTQRPTIELPAFDDEIPSAFTRDTQELVSSPQPARPLPSEDVELRRRASLSKTTMHSSPPPPPLPPPPTSAVDEEDGRPGRRARSPTLHGLPEPELTPRAGSTKRVATVGNDPPLASDEGDEVTIISLAAPLAPSTARGRIELDDEDWVTPGSGLASDSQQGRIDSVIDAVVSGGASVDRLLEHGDDGLLRLVAQFPGPLDVLRRDLRALPPPSAHGPLIRTLIAVGAPAVPHLIELFEHPNPDVRFYAGFVFHELRDTRCMRPLGKLAFDNNGDVRIVSMRVLETYRRAEGFDAAAAIVREQLGNESRTQQLHSARAAGTLRDVGAIEQLIELLAANDRFIQEASLESLCSITGQQHGLKPHRWRAWYEEHGQRHRVEWIIDSLRHRDLPVRRWAADELVRITGQRVPFSPMGDKRARDIAAKAWTDWWEATGRELFAGER